MASAASESSSVGPIEWVPAVPPDWDQFGRIDEQVPIGGYSVEDLLEFIESFGHQNETHQLGENIINEQYQRRDRATPPPVYRPLPPLPQFFQHQQLHDKLLNVRARVQPAVIFTDNLKNGSGNWGSFYSGSDFRFRTVPITTLPIIRIEVRMNHLTEADNGTRRRKAPKPSGMYVNEGQRRDPNTTNPNQLEDYLEFDVDVAKNFSVVTHEQLPPDILVRMRSNGIREYSGDIPPPRYGIFIYESHRNDPPVRMYGQQNDFPHGSAQAAFFQHIKGQPTNFVVICEIHPQVGNPKWRESDDATWYAFKLLTNALRHNTIDGQPGNDWYLRRDAKYFESGFDKYIEDAQQPLPVIPWLLQGQGPQTNTIYPPQPDPTRIFQWRKVFPSLKIYKLQNIGAMLYERQEDVRQNDVLFNFNRQHTVVFQSSVERKFLIHIKVNRDRTRTALTVPFNGTDVTIMLVDFSTQGDASVSGKVYGMCREGFDFAVEAKVESSMPVQSEHGYSAIVLPEYKNNDAQRKLKHLSRLNVYKLPRQPTHTLPIVDGRRRGYFRLANIIFEPDLDVFSPNFVQNFITKGGARHEEIAAQLKHLWSGGGLNLNEQQRQFLNACIVEGVPANIAILDGWSGTGKSLTLATLTYVMHRLGQTIIAEGQSNNAVRSMHDKVIGLLDSIFPDGSAEAASIKAKIVHVHSPDRERYFLRLLEGLTPPPPGVVPQDCMAARIISWVDENAEEPLAKEYKNRRQTDLNGQRGGKQRSMSAIIKDMETEVFKTINLIFCTCYVASDLHRRNVQADVVILDEAAQASEPDAIVSLSEQRKVCLVILAGDEQQLGPVVKSTRAGTTPYGDVLQISLLTRLMAGYPHIVKISLVVNYRAHPNLIPMPSAVFYDNRLQAAPHTRWDVVLKRTMDHLLRSGVLGGFGRQMVASDARQIFYNVLSMARREIDGHSWANDGGDDAVADWTEAMVRAGVPRAFIGIITMYKHDAAVMRTILAQRGLYGVEISDQEDGVETATVDAFQGREKKIILIHFVAADPSGKSGLGHIANACRLCVAATRAQEYQFFFGNITHWRQTGNLQLAEQMRKLVDFCEHAQQVLDWNRVTIQRASPRARRDGDGYAVRVQDMEEVNNV
ncbi:hypothetical protein MBLNU13_g05333t2 [Cladosporium sp. NU13]